MLGPLQTGLGDILLCGVEGEEEAPQGSKMQLPAPQCPVRVGDLGSDVATPLAVRSWPFTPLQPFPISRYLGQCTAIYRDPTGPWRPCPASFHALGTGLPHRSKVNSTSSLPGPSGTSGVAKT